MKTFIIPIILIGTSIGIFVFFTNKTYSEINKVKAENADYEIALDKSREVLKKRTELGEQFKKFSQKNLDTISNIVPDSVDNIQLILDMDGIAKRKGMELKSIKIEEEKVQKDPTIVPQKSVFSSISLSFKTSGSYNNFVEFLTELERSQRIVDVTALSFKSADTGVYDYSVTIRTYWLK